MNYQVGTQMDLEGLDPLKNRRFIVRKRNGKQAPFDKNRIHTAIEKAFKADISLTTPDQELPKRTSLAIDKITQSVIEEIISNCLQGNALGVEGIQDVVEKKLMEAGYYTVARRYIVYREEHSKARILKEHDENEQESGYILHITHPDGTQGIFNSKEFLQEVSKSCRHLEGTCSPEVLTEEIIGCLYDGISIDELDKAMILTAKSKIEQNPNYTYVASRMLLRVIYKQVFGKTGYPTDIESLYRKSFLSYIELGIKKELLSSELATFDLPRLSQALLIKNDLKFSYMGLQTLYDRYLLHIKERRIETPQYFWMRVAMGLAMNEKEKEQRAIEFYHVLSSFYFISSTPTLFNSGTLHPQLSSCYLSTIMDDLQHIFKVISDDAVLSKWAGGLGNDWTSVRATGAYIKGTNGRSQGVIPFLKVANDTAVAVNQGGKRKGAMCAYLETWHLDIEDFLELRKNTGDERRRTHDMNTANWIPDLFMKRVIQEKHWTLFSPEETPDLHDLYGKNFEKRYHEYEKMAEAGLLRQSKKVEAMTLWRKMLSMLYETGHPWITFKDPSNIRSSQDHIGVVHSSNLCTEILLNTSENETAVCNLGSINLAEHVTELGIDEILLEKTIKTAIRMLDNVVDINFYPTVEAKNANLRHRPIGMGVMGVQDALYRLRISYADKEAVEFADKSMEMISYHAIITSAELAKERGSYSTFKGSKWDRGILPIDTIALLREERGNYVEVEAKTTLDWQKVRDVIATHGMRNSNTMAIAPTATISNIVGVTQSIEPSYKNLFVKSNLSGEFTVINAYLVEELQKLNLWDEMMVEDLKYYDGSIQDIDRIPEEIKKIFLTAFEIEPQWLIESASRRQKWIDMGQSLNLYLAEPNGRLLSQMYQLAWRKGLKTTYYLRSLGATQIEKATVDVNRRGIQPRWMKNRSASSNIHIQRKPSDSYCSVFESECESCQ